jgi:hypothetical protein
MLNLIVLYFWKSIVTKNNKWQQPTRGIINKGVGGFQRFSPAIKYTHGG